MAEVRFTAEAKEDLRSIYTYIAQDSVRYAEAQVDRFIQEAARLADFPRSGRMIPEINDPEFREVIVGNYRMMYRIVNKQLLEVMMIHHGARRFLFKRSS